MSALRSLCQVSRIASRSRIVSGMRVSALAAPRAAVTVTPAVRAFSGSARRLGSGASDIPLSQKLQEELQYEKEARANESSPEFLRNFLEQGVWSIEDIPGHDEVALTRKFGDENIRIIFSIADIQADTEFEPENEDPGDEADESPNPSSPVRAALTITKTSGPGALSVDMVCQDSHFLIENISFYEDAKLSQELTAEADWKRRGLYIGPAFETLDVGVQDEFDKYLQERGINENVAAFIPDYAAHKEQQEYVKWLNKVKRFVDL